ncbi:hypothetical protein EDD18DRAFT_1112484 [Armillaria luteobubalina]|uniref:Uncharacterized protein n=1 Tax=Armillaria luteobubalina TaxID=153913 RepID=A0AA39UHJ5_9AGAR|nr:hypothetical protein EDD18DRAFT_1112484 [Armillaria luteobubalina]
MSPCKEKFCPYETSSSSMVRYRDMSPVQWKTCGCEGWDCIYRYKCQGIERQQIKAECKKWWNGKVVLKPWIYPVQYPSFLQNGLHLTNLQRAQVLEKSNCLCHHIVMAYKDSNMNVLTQKEHLKCHKITQDLNVHIIQAKQYYCDIRMGLMVLSEVLREWFWQAQLWILEDSDVWRISDDEVCELNGARHIHGPTGGKKNASYSALKWVVLNILSIMRQTCGCLELQAH